MIGRMWHGRTSRENADAYEHLLQTEIFHGIADRKIAGFRGIELLRRDDRDPVEFVTLMWFDSIGAVRTCAGHDYDAAVVPPAARALLLQFDERSTHHEVRQPRDQSRPVREPAGGNRAPAGNRHCMLNASVLSAVSPETVAQAPAA